MKYLFKAIGFTLTNIIQALAWVVCQFFIIIWHFDFKHIKQYGEFEVKYFSDCDMIRWTIVFLVMAIVSAIFGFAGIAGSIAAIGKIFFFISMVLFVLSLIASGER